VIRRFIAGALLPAVLVSQTAFADGVSVDKATQAERKQANDAYASGMKDFEDDDYEKALVGFEASYKLVKSPNSHFMIARTYARLGRNVEAYNELDAVIAEAQALGTRYEPTIESARDKQGEVRPRIGILTVSLAHAPKGSRAVIGGETLTPDASKKPIAVLPGETKIELLVPDGTRYAQLVRVTEGGNVNVELTAPESHAPVVEQPLHQPYRIELGAHVAGETVVPSDTASRGAGLGIRGGIQLIPRGILGEGDSVGLMTGFDWIGSSNQAHAFVPLQAQWNFWVIPDLSFLLEAGAAFTFGADTKVVPALHAGARFRVYKKLYVTGRVGIPTATIGVSLLL
jgi:hypothetical protein